jgi:hypothetical protein
MQESARSLEPGHDDSTKPSVLRAMRISHAYWGWGGVPVFRGTLYYFDGCGENGFGGITVFMTPSSIGARSDPVAQIPLVRQKKHAQC